MTRAKEQSAYPTVAERLWDGWSVRRVWFSAGLAAVVATAVALVAPWWVVLLVVLGLLLSLCFRGCRRPLWCLLVVAAVTLSVTTTGYRHLWVTPLTALSGKQDVVVGRVLVTNGAMVTLQVTEAKMVPSGTKLALFCDSEYAPTAGDTVSATVVLDTSSRTTTTDVFLFADLVEEDEPCLTVLSSGTPSVWEGAYWRNLLYRSLCRVLPGTEGTMVAALCLGVKEYLPQSVNEAFRNSGLAHLLVVSGLHLSLLAMTSRRLLRRLGVSYRLSAVLTVPVVLLFMWLVGFTPSVCRAGVMCLVWLGGYCLGRRSDGLNALGLAATLILLQNPYTLWSVGFQLSFLATAGLLVLYPRFRCWMPRVSPESTGLVRLGQKCLATMYSAAVVCISALLFTLPVVCYYFDGLSLLSPVANLLAVAPAGWALLMGWVGILLNLVPGLGWLAQPVLYATGFLTRYLRLVADSLSIDACYLTTDTLWMRLLVVALCLIAAVAIVCRIPWRRVLAWCLTLMVLTAAVGVPLTNLTTRVQISALPGGTAVVLHHRGRTALLLTDSAGLEEATYAYRGWGCARLDAVVVGQGQPMDVSHLTALIEKTRAPAVYTAATQQWTVSSGQTATYCAAGTTRTLWEGCRITFVTDRWWLLETTDGSLLLGQEAESAPPVTADLTVFAGVPTEPLTTRGVVVCSAGRLSRHAPEIGDRAYLLTEGSVTYTTCPGKEWSVLSWL